MLTPKKIMRKDLKCPKYFFQYWPLGGRKFGDTYYLPEITLYRLETSEYAGRTYYHSTSIATFRWQCNRRDDDHSKWSNPYGFSCDISSDGIGSIDLIRRILVGLRCTSWDIGFRAFVREMRKNRIPRWQHERWESGEHMAQEPVPHKYASIAKKYDDVRRSVA